MQTLNDFIDQAQKQRGDEHDGLCVKYDVKKIEDGTAVQNCFVLRPDKDPAAARALLAYADATDNEDLAADIKKWVKSNNFTRKVWEVDGEKDLPPRLYIEDCGKMYFIELDPDREKYISGYDPSAEYEFGRDTIKEWDDKPTIDTVVLYYEGYARGVRNGERYGKGTGRNEIMQQVSAVADMIFGGLIKEIGKVADK